MEHKPQSVELTPLQRFNQAFDTLIYIAEPVRGRDNWQSIAEDKIFINNPKDPKYSPSINYETKKAYASKKWLDPESPYYNQGEFNKSVQALQKIEFIVAKLVEKHLIK